MLLKSSRWTQAVCSLLLASCCFTEATHIQSRATVCNGHAELCNRGFGNVTFVGAHNSYAVGINNLSTNQDYDITQQLNDGIRMLQMQAHNSNGAIHLCHTTCSLYDGGTLTDYLKTVKTWMDANPNEVVSLLIVNSDNLPPTQYASSFVDAGLDTMSFVPDAPSLPSGTWPTLGSLIDSGKRLITFLSTTADFTSVPYLIDEFSSVWESPFGVTDPGAFDCSINRTRGDPTTQMFLINHFLDKPFGGIAAIPVPDRASANVTNSASGLGSLGQHVSTCVTQHGRNPNFLLVDFYEYGGGSVFQVAADANGVSYAPTTPIVTPKPQGSNNNSNTDQNSTGFRVTVDQSSVMTIGILVSWAYGLILAL